MLTDREIKLVKIRMVILGWTQDELAKYVGVSRISINMTMNRKRNTKYIIDKLREFIIPLNGIDIKGL